MVQSHGLESKNEYKGESKLSTVSTFLCLLTTDVTGPFDSGSCHHDFPTMMDCALEPWGKMNSPFLKLLRLRGILLEHQEKQLRQGEDLVTRDSDRVRMEGNPRVTSELTAIVCLFIVCCFSFSS